MVTIGIAEHIVDHAIAIGICCNRDPIGVHRSIKNAIGMGCIQTAFDAIVNTIVIAVQVEHVWNTIMIRIPDLK